MDVEQLMKKHTLAELKEVEKKLRTDVERKKEDLRQLVASRYRELIDAADKIKNMHLTATSVTSQLVSLSSQSTQHLFDPRAPLHRVTQNVAEKRDDSALLDDAVRRLLHVAPETIFLSLDSDDPLRAALFYAFVRNLVWQRNVEMGSLSQLPSWIYLRSHEGFILDAVASFFEKISFQPLELSRCVCGLLIVSSAATKTSVLSDFLSRRSMVLTGLLTGSSSLPVREAFELALQSVLSTLRGVHEVFYAQSLFGFVENESAAIKAWIFHAVLQIEIIPHVPELSTSYDGILNVLNFEDPNFIQNSFVRDRMHKWTTDACTETVVLLEKLLECVPSIQSVLNIRKTLDAIVLEENSKAPSAKILARDLSVSLADVIGCFDDATKRRYAGLISDRLGKVLLDVEARLSQDVIATSPSEKPYDFTCSLSSVSAGVGTSRRFPGRARQAASGKSPVHPADQPSALNIVARNLSTLWTDMCPPNQPLSAESSWVLDELAAAYRSSFQKLSRVILEIVNNVDGETRRLCLTVLHRFLRSLRSAEFQLIHADVPVSSREALVEIIHHEVDSCAGIVFQKWLETVIDRWKAETIAELRQNLDPVLWALKSSPFQKVTVEEANESGDKVNYVLSVPSKSSILFHTYMKSLHDELAEFSSGSTKSLISDSALNRCFSALLSCYEELIQSLTSLTKNQALQWMFDVKTALAFGRTRRGFPMGTIKGFQAVVERLSTFVDPIDYNVLLPYLDRNVEIYSESVRNLFFSLTSLDSGAGRVSSAETVKGAQSSVIQFKPIWFSQLPVTNTPKPMGKL